MESQLNRPPLNETRRNSSQLILKWLLIVSGAFLISAFAAMLLPVATMDSVHDWLGLGDFPNRPITVYLARSTSLMYGIHGVLMLYTGLTLQHHWRLVKLFGWLHVVIGVSMLIVDFMASMPWYWTAFEGPPVTLLGVLIIYLAKQSFAKNTPAVL